MTANASKLEKVSLCDTENRKTVNKFTTDDKYSLLNRDNLTQAIQMQLPGKQKTFSQLFSKF